MEVERGGGRKLVDGLNRLSAVVVLHQNSDNHTRN